MVNEGTSVFTGIVIEQSLRDPGVVAQFQVEARRRIGSWNFLLVRVDGSDFEQHLETLQGAMRPNQPWYAHYFRDEELAIAFQDAIVRVGTNPETWDPAVEHGLARGIPREQLDFRPRTRADALEFFELSEKDRQPEPS